MADFVLLNKTDLVEETQCAQAESTIRGVNPQAEIFRTNQSQVNLRELLDMNAFDVDRKLAVDPQFLEELEHRHHAEIFSLSFRFDQPFNVDRFEQFVQALSSREKVYRSKGIIAKEKMLKYISEQEPDLRKEAGEHTRQASAWAAGGHPIGE